MTEELHRDIPVSLVRVIPGAAHWVAHSQLLSTIRRAFARDWKI